MIPPKHINLIMDIMQVMQKWTNQALSHISKIHKDPLSPKSILGYSTIYFPRSELERRRDNSVVAKLSRINFNEIRTISMRSTYFSRRYVYCTDDAINDINEYCECVLDSKVHGYDTGLRLHLCRHHFEHKACFVLRARRMYKVFYNIKAVRKQYMLDLH